MPRYLVERTFFVTEQEMQEVGRRSRELAAEKFPEIVWEHSHVLLDDAGNVKTFCVYGAPDTDTVQRHAEALGQHRVDKIQEIAGDVTPADFPSI
ncbi:MAG TPA: nickel-binding protein [Mycobacteriales bacterium]|nr:nickel-binding protein [Mycobacteriales bacterium]